jgi:peptidoglycan/LPS O-acetylase OafA/YrhL
LHWLGSNYDFYKKVLKIQFPYLLRHFIAFGFLGVDIFFILSGVVIAKSIINASPWSFAVSRIMRIYPEFVLAIILTMAVEPFAVKEFSFPHALYSMTLLNLFTNTPGVIDQAWTLKYETEFYVVVLIFLFYLFKRKKVHDSKIIYILHIWILVLFTLNTFAGTRAYNFFAWQGYAPYFILGASLTLSLRRSFLIVAVSSILVFKKMFLRIAFLNGNASHYFLLVGLISVVIVLVLLSDLLDKSLNRFLPSKVIKNLSLMTYPIYLLSSNFALSLFTILYEANHSLLLSYGLSFSSLIFVSYYSSIRFQPWVIGLFAKFDAKCTN